MDRLRELWAAGLPSFAMWAAIADPVSAETIGRAGYDAVILDTQHGGITWDTLLPLVQALDLGGTRALVRTGRCDQAEIMRALDVGALGVIVPMVSTAEQARTAAEAMRYPPRGVRSFGPVRSYYSAQGQAAEPVCLVMIETVEALQNLDAIAATPGVDGLFVGPVDLALSLGLGPVLEARDEIFAAMDKVVAACRRHGKVSGAASLGTPYAKRLIEAGMQFIAQGADIGFIRRGAAAELATLHGWRDEMKPATQDASAPAA